MEESNCPICLEPFVDPVHFLCTSIFSHTFCGMCIAKYLKHNRLTSDGKCICPMCRRIVEEIFAEEYTSPVVKVIVAQYNSGFFGGRERRAEGLLLLLAGGEAAPRFNNRRVTRQNEDFHYLVITSATALACFAFGFSLMYYL